MSKNYDASWEDALTVVLEAQPPFIPEGAHAMTVVIDRRSGIVQGPGAAARDPAYNSPAPTVTSTTGDTSCTCSRVLPRC